MLKTELVLNDFKQYYCFLGADHDCRLRDRHLAPIPTSIQNGLYAYLIYNQSVPLLVLRELCNHQSLHGGIQVTAQSTLRKLNTSNMSSSSLSLHFFDQRPTVHQPAFAGELLWYDGIAFWNFESGSYSAENPLFTDEYTEWCSIVESVGLPPERFIKHSQTTQVKATFLNQLKPNGHFPDTVDAGDFLEQIKTCIGVFPWKGATKSLSA